MSLMRYFYTMMHFKAFFLKQGGHPREGVPALFDGDEAPLRTHRVSAAERRKLSFHALLYSSHFLFVGREIRGSIIRGLPRMMRRIPISPLAVAFQQTKTLCSTSSVTPCHQRARRRIVARGARRAAHLGLLALGKTASRQTVHRTVCRSLTPQGEGLVRAPRSGANFKALAIR